MGALGGRRQVTCISMRPEGNGTLEKGGSSLAAPSKKTQSKRNKEQEKTQLALGLHGQGAHGHGAHRYGLLY